MTCVIPSQCHTILLFLMPVIQLIYSSSVEAHLLWKCCYMLIPCSHKPWIAWDVLHVMSNVTGISGNLCNKCPKWLVEQISSYSDYFNVISGFTLNSRALGGPVTFWHPIWDQRLPKLLKLSYCSLTAKCDILPKMCKNCQKKCAKPKMTKTALSGVSQQSSSQGVCESVLWVPECFTSKSRPGQAQTGPVRPRSLVQPSPAFSSWFQPGQGPGVLHSCPEVQGECLAFRELPREVTRPRSPSQCPGMCPDEAQAMWSFSP